MAVLDETELDRLDEAIGEVLDLPEPFALEADEIVQIKPRRKKPAKKPVKKAQVQKPKQLQLA